MIKSTIKSVSVLFLLTFSVFSLARPTEIIDEGAGLPLGAVMESKLQAQEALDEYLNAKSKADENEESRYSDNDVYEALGVETVSLDDSNQYDTTNPHNPLLMDGGRQGYSMGRRGNVSVSCSEGSYVDAGDLGITVVNCDDGVLLANVCDAGANGFYCDATRSVQVSIDSISQNLSGHPLNGTYSLKAECLDNSCDIDFSSSVENSFATSAADNLVDANNAKDLYMQEGSYFMDYVALGSPTDPEMADLVAETKVEANDYSECFQDRLGELNDDGKVRQSCDPNTVDTFQFLVDNREGDNYGKQMCARSETGSCIENIEIHERLDYSGTQTCTSQHSKTSGSCTVTTSSNTVENYVVDAGGHSRRAPSSVDCGDSIVGGVPYKCTNMRFRNYSTYGDNNLGNRVRADNYVLIPLNPRDVHRVRVRSTRFDDYFRVFVGKDKTNSGSSYVLNTSNNWGTGSDYKNTSFGWTNVTNSIKGMSSLANASSFYVNPSLWSVGKGEYDVEVEVIYKKYTTTLSSSNNCSSYDAKNPNASSVQGCYQSNSQDGTCTDSTPRVIHGETIDPGCWAYRKDYTCYSGSATGCNTALLQNNGWVKTEEKNKEYPSSATGQNTNQPWKWDEVWSYTGTNNLDQSLGCAPTTSTSRTDATGGTINTAHTWCYKTAPKECRPSPPETAEEITKCHVEASRSVEYTHGLTTKQEQDYKCETAYVCEGAFGNSVDDESQKANNTKALAKIMAESEKAKAISESLSDNMSLDENGNITVFEGEKSTCNKWHSRAFDNLDLPQNYALKTLIGNSVGGLDRGARNCCLDNPDEVKLGTNFDNCKNEDIELAAKRMEKAAHLIEINQADIAEADVSGEDEEEVDTSLVTVCTVAVKATAEVEGGKEQKCFSLGVKFTVTSDSSVFRMDWVSITPEVDLGPFPKGQESYISSWLITVGQAPGCAWSENAAFGKLCNDEKEASSINLNRLNAAISSGGYTVGSTQSITSSRLFNPATITMPASICKEVSGTTTVTTITTDKKIGNIAAGARSESQWNSLIANEMATNSSIFQDGQNAQGNKRYCYQHLAYDDSLVIYNEGGKRYFLDESGRKIYYSDIQQPAEEEIDVSGNWLPGNRNMCLWTLDSRARLNPAVGGAPAVAGTIATPGTRDVWDWFNDFRKIFNSPFVCQYSIFDIVSTVEVDSFQTWCTFDSVFARLVHEQGRKQLALYATQPYTGAITDRKEFSFYKDGSGAWTSSKIVNGNDVRFWQWPRECSPRKELVSNYKGASMATDQSCPLNADIYVAVCAKQGTCGDLPRNPVLESTGWETLQIRGENAEIQALTPLVVVKGVCTSDGECGYDLHAWKSGVGGYVDIPLDMNWQLQSPQSGWNLNYVSHNSAHFMAYTYPIDGNAAGGPKLKMCIGSMVDCDATDLNSASWTTISLQEPTALQGQVLRAANPRVTATGQCSKTTANCSYRITIGVKLKAKPWHTGITHDTFKHKLRPKILGKPIGPTRRDKYNYNVKADCSGFTLDEFLALDIAAMDLTEFTDKVAADAEAKLLEMTSNGSLNFAGDVETLIAGGSVIKTDTGTTNFTLSPNNGFAGQKVQLKPIYSNKDFGISVSKDGKVFTEKVSSIVIDWGDGETSTVGAGINAEHTYGDRNSPPAQSHIINGTIKWNTTTGVYSEGFTYKMWMEGDDAGRNTAGGGISVDAPTNGATTITGGAVSPIKQLQNAPPEIRQLDPNNW